jgi:hypothetical protein
MRSAIRMGVYLAAFGLAITGCGDGDTGGDGRSVQPGFFIGTTAEGGNLAIAVGSIRAIFFRCGATTISQRFVPAEPVAGDGSFAVDFQANGQSFLVTGRIEDDTIRGTITGNLDCAGDFVAHRCNSSRQECGDRDGDLIPDEVDPDSGGTVTPSPTPTASGPTATAAPTSTPLPASATPTGPSPTPSPSASATFTPSPTVSPTPNGTCGNGQLESDEECDFKGPIFDTDLCEGSCSCIDFCDTPGGTLTCAGDCTISFDECAAGPDNCF